MQSETVYYNPLDRRCWKAIAAGLPLLLVIVAALGLVGWYVWGHTNTTGPAAWLHKPWLPVGFALLGGFVIAVGTGLAWTIGLFAHAIGYSLTGTAHQNHGKQ